MNIVIHHAMIGRNRLFGQGETHDKILPYMTLCYCVSGEYSVCLDNRHRFTVKSGECFYAPANQNQHIIHHSSPDSPMDAIWIHMNISVNQNYDLQTFYDFPFVLSNATGARLYQLMNEHCSFSLQDELHRQIKQRKIEFEILDCFLEEGTKKTFSLSPETERAVQYISEHQSEPVGIADVAAYCNISESNLFKRFKQETGLSPKQYILTQKASRASVLLLETDQSIAQIGRQLGFYDQFHFSREFKKLYHAPPSVYRAQHRAQL